jgi:hypothetical protein
MRERSGGWAHWPVRNNRHFGSRQFAGPWSTRWTDPREITGRAMFSHGLASLATRPLRFLQHEMGGIFRSLAIGYGKPKRMQIQTVQ